MHSYKFPGIIMITCLTLSLMVGCGGKGQSTPAGDLDGTKYTVGYVN